jgi:glycosyltransferase involved in cell wall biosynthesis
MSSSAVTSQMPAANVHERSLQVIGLFPDLLGVGGVQEAGRLTAAALSDIVRDSAGHTTFLTLNDTPGVHVVEVSSRNVSIRGYGRAKARFVLSGIGHVRSLRKSRVGVIIAGHPHLALPAVLMQRFAPGLKIIVMAHGIEVWSPLSHLRRRALLGADVVLAPSRFTAQKLIEVQGVPLDKIRVLPWPMNTDFLRRAAEPAALPLPPEFPSGEVILTVGRWAASERYKGVDELIRAIATLRSSNPDLQLVAVGGGDDLPRLAGLAASLNVSDCVHFFAGLSREQIAGCYSRCDIFALPSTGEGFGLVFLEAMAFAKPVVGVAFGGTIDVVEDGVNGSLVPPRDMQGLSDALSKLLHDEPLRARLGQAGAEIVRTKYCFGRFRENLQQIVDECISSGTEHRSLS